MPPVFSTNSWVHATHAASSSMYALSPNLITASGHPSISASFFLKCSGDSAQHGSPNGQFGGGSERRSDGRKDRGKISATLPTEARRTECDGRRRRFFPPRRCGRRFLTPPSFKRSHGGVLSQRSQTGCADLRTPMGVARWLMSARACAEFAGNDACCYSASLRLACSVLRRARAARLAASRVSFFRSPPSHHYHIPFTLPQKCV